MTEEKRELQDKFSRLSELERRKVRRLVTLKEKYDANRQWWRECGQDFGSSWVFDDRRSYEELVAFATNAAFARQVITNAVESLRYDATFDQEAFAKGFREGVQLLKEIVDSEPESEE